MRKNEKTLLAGVAALALIAGTGLAAAQQGNGMSGNGRTPSSSRSLPRSALKFSNSQPHNGSLRWPLASCAPIRL